MPTGWAIRFATAGVKPDVCERCTLYRETPTLSLDAVQPSVADPIEVDAERPEGAVGGDVSGGGGEPPTAVCMSCCTSAALSARL